MCDNCGLRFSRLINTDQKCIKCGVIPICPDCFNKTTKICRDCRKKIQASNQKIGAIGCLVVISMVGFLFVLGFIEQHREDAEKARTAEIVRITQEKNEKEQARIKAEEASQELERIRNREKAITEARRRELGIIEGSSMQPNLVYKTVKEIQVIVYDADNKPGKKMLPEGTYFLFLGKESLDHIGDYNISEWYLIRYSTSSETSTIAWVNPNDMLEVFL